MNIPELKRIIRERQKGIKTYGLKTMKITDEVHFHYDFGFVAGVIHTLQWVLDEIKKSESKK